MSDMLGHTYLQVTSIIHHLIDLIRSKVVDYSVWRNVLLPEKD